MNDVRYAGRHEVITVERYVEVLGWPVEEAREMMREGNTEPRVFVVQGDGTETELENGRKDYSPDGFAWGYQGSGPSALAYSILQHATGVDVEPSVAIAFRDRFISPLDTDEDFSLSQAEVEDWVARQPGPVEAHA